MTEGRKTGRLILAATPIGNPADASPRLTQALLEADVIAAEDTRRVKRLFTDLGIKPAGRIISYYDAVEKERSDELVDAALAGGTVVVVSDAGMPAVSDPGYRVVSRAVECGIDVTALPGPSAVLVALAVSGMPTDRFCFEGFLPRKAGERAQRIAEIASEPRTLVFFEAPHRLVATLQALASGLGAERQGVVCREMTKTYEEVIRGSLSELIDWASGEVRGEVTLVIAGASKDELRMASGLTSPEAWCTRVAELVAQGHDRKEAIAYVAKVAGVPKREVYDAVVKS